MGTEMKLALSCLRHDVRNRMTCIYSSLEFLERLELSEEDRSLLITIKQEAEAILVLVDEFSRILGYQPPGNSSPEALGSFLEQ